MRSILGKWYCWWARLPADVKPETVRELLRLVGFSRIDTYARWDKVFHPGAYKGTPVAG
jgi:hypothetical protein